MEFLVYTMCAVAVYLTLFKPTKEKWAFGLMAGSFVTAAAMYLIAASSSWIPTVNL